MSILPKLKTQQGFTLIELLVVVIVISALSGIVISMINSGGFRDKARDSQRIAELKQIQTALELYFSDFREYPDSDGNGGFANVNGSNDLSTALQTSYMNKVPTDPEALGSNTGPCQNPENFRYNYISDGTYYILTATMAVTSSNDDSACDSLNSWNSCGGSFENQDVCYGVENP